MKKIEVLLIGALGIGIGMKGMKVPGHSILLALAILGWLVVQAVGFVRSKRGGEQGEVARYMMGLAAGLLDGLWFLHD